MIPQSVIDDIRQRADIVEIISDYVQLNPSGRNFKALSPFTQEKTPSFVVSPDKQIYKCFSTGKGGNVFSFLMEMEKVNFPEAVELVAKRTGIDISRFGSQETPARKEEEKGMTTLRWAARLFHQTLMNETGKKGLAYLAAGRGLSAETITAFGLGYAPESWDHLLHESQRAGIDEKLLAELGLLTINRQKNSRYDTFRNRVIFPILTVGGQVAGFGGRTLSNDPDAPKYLNSPESRMFEKSKLLYGLHAAKQNIRRTETAILVEGYMDVLALHQAGITNAVASCGTSLTRHQAKTLQRYTSTVLFIYDADPAGKKSMMSGIDILLTEGITPTVLILPPGDDPDSFVRREGRKFFMEYTDKNRLSFIDFQLRYFMEAGSFENPDAKAGAIRIMVETISNIPDRIRKELYLQELSEKLHVSMPALLELTGHKPAQQRFRPNGEQTTHKNSKNRKQKTLQITVLEKTFLKALLESTIYGNAVLEFAASHEEMLELKHPAAREILYHMIRRYRQCAENKEDMIDPVTEISMFATTEARNLASGLLIEQPVSSRWQERPEAEREHARRCLTAFLDAFKTIILDQLVQRKERVTEALREENDNDKALLLQKEIIELNTTIRKTSSDLGVMISGILEGR
ncbi:MAG: DNA primase [Chlorobium sp.]|jgi:DNA primase|uniref:DNA primase n=1 Tax=Chlorobium sp. TaxID=1095 RepID=UPI0025C1CA05|nr:DNA primase [Chlorobium sp.]MCF8215251.1 DNA primase [Chlorobium sp.]MCF8270086.1 DNA primase [Chlorobium sp.]MCF8286457.1 DNA primase [Chlorobium sp.]MCF8290055.1 DNA primase [Chlorobium sp.]MCF8384126.1 DNA primase [Chlorobium sp.]